MYRLPVWLIGLYRRFISPYLGRNCRFEPTCSQYSQEALMRHGIVAGLLLTVFRILRCNPFCRGGKDPAPWDLPW